MRPRPPPSYPGTVCALAARKEKNLLIEDKTKEQQPASPVKPKRGQRLRSLWAQLQCMGLLHRHRLRRKTQNHVNDFGRKLAQNSAVPVIGETLYALGYSTEYGFVRVGRGLRSGWLWLWQAFTTLLANAAAMAFPGAAQMFRDCSARSGCSSGAAVRCWCTPNGCGKKKALPQPAKPAYIIWPAACAAT